MDETKASNNNMELRNVDDKTSAQITCSCEDKKIPQTYGTVEDTDFDDLLIHAGEFGKYQILLFLSTMPFYIFGVFVYFSQMFMTEASSQYWCWVPELANLTSEERRVLAIPLDESGRYGYSQCTAYVANWTEVLATGTAPQRSSWQTQKCQHGWEFNMTEIPYPTLTTEWGWVCDQDSYQATAQSIFFAGSIIGGVIFGWLADKRGRLPVIVASNVVACIGGVASVFSRNFVEFCICRFIMGMGYDNCMMMSYLLVLEYIAPRYKTLVSNLAFAVFYSSGAVALPWICRACGHWQTIGLVTSLPLALAVLSPCVFLESPRWLLSNGRVDDALNKLKKIAAKNNKEVPTKLIEQFKVALSKQKKEENTSLLDVMKRSPLRKSLICTCVLYMCCAIVFDALVRCLGQLDFDFFVSFSVVSFTEFPSLVVVALIMDWTGRRWLTLVSLLISCVFSIAIAFIGGGLLSVSCAVIARFAVNMGMTAAMQWAAETLATPVRGSGVSLVHICGSIATVISPYIVYLETILIWLPLLVVGIISLIGALTALGIPETAKKDMPQTFDEAEAMTRNDKLWEMPCASKNKTNNIGIDGKTNKSFEP